MTLADHLRSWRKQAGLSTREAGELLGLSARTVEGIEQGRRYGAEPMLRLALDRLREISVPTGTADAAE